MSRHRAAQPAHRHLAPPVGRRRAEQVRPRYGRLAVLGASLSVTGIAMLGGVGVLPSVASGSDGSSIDGSSIDGGGTGAGSGTGQADAPAGDQVLAGADSTASVAPSETPDDTATADPPEGTVPSGPSVPSVPSPPEGSGEGRRIVFDQSDQRVWLVRDDGSVARTYLVSGSTYDNLDPGTYSVYSRSAHATGIEQSGTMRYFVRFAEGDTGSAIGFHDIPLSGGEPVQTQDQLGTPQSHGCIRQARKDAIALWGFAPIGTEVDVVA